MKGQVTSVGHLHLLRSIGHRAEHTPCERAVVVRVEPRVEVVGDGDEVETRFLRRLRLLNQVSRAVQLAEQRVPELRHVSSRVMIPLAGKRVVYPRTAGSTRSARDRCRLVHRPWSDLDTKTFEEGIP